MSDSLGSYNPILSLPYVPAFESLGADYADPVAAADFPAHLLRFRNDDIWPLLGLEPADITDEAVIEAFAQFQGRSPFLAMRYHGYQFGEYNPYLGDGRGFLYGQVRGTDDKLYDFGTKGSGTTPYSRGGDGRLTLKGGVREVIAAEALYRYGVNTSRCLSMAETGEQLWRGDEPSPTRSSVMIRFSHSHIRFGTFERLYYLQRGDLVKTLLDHVIEYYYPHLQRFKTESDRYGHFFTELVQRVATLAAQWMSVGFCHGVLNTDNMSITGESFDYGPYAFMETFDPTFTAAYFDYGQRYCYSNQARMCQWNLELLQYPLKMVMATSDIEAGLEHYQTHYYIAYSQRMMQRLGFEGLMPELADDLLKVTLQVLRQININYNDFFLALRRQFRSHWQQDQNAILYDLFTSAQALTSTSSTDLSSPTKRAKDDSDTTPLADNGLSHTAGLTLIDQWRSLYHQALNQYPSDQMTIIAQRLDRHNPDTVPIRAEIEAIWDPIAIDDNWQPFDELIKRLQQSVVG